MSLPDPTTTSPEARSAQRLRRLEQRVAALENQRMPQIAGAPTAAAQDGSEVADSTNLRYWLRVNGAWRYVALTTPV